LLQASIEHRHAVIFQLEPGHAALLTGEIGQAVMHRRAMALLCLSVHNSPHTALMRAIVFVRDHLQTIETGEKGEDRIRSMPI